MKAKTKKQLCNDSLIIGNTVFLIQREISLTKITD